ncbi:hypothetical protein B0T10DRAFT_419501, partial [Thelonectria olida]
QATRWVLIALATAVILARGYLRLRIQRQIISSDIFMFLAWCAAVASACVDIRLAQLGALEKQVMSNLAGYTGGPDQIVQILKLFWAANLPFFTTFYLCKAALLTVYLQIFPPFMRKRRIILWAVIGYVIVSYIVSVAMALFYCWPVQTSWSLDPIKACTPSKGEQIFQLGWALHFAGDLMIFALPWSIVTNLQMGRSMKTGVFCTFLLGIINIVFCLVRFIHVQISTVGSSVPLSLIALWSALDQNIGLVIACLPALRPFFRRKESRDYYGSGPDRYRGTDLGAAEAGRRVTCDPYARELGPDNIVNASGAFDAGSLDDGKRSQSSVVELIRIPIERK